jgi:hypothetical protein
MRRLDERVRLYAVATYHTRIAEDGHPNLKSTFGEYGGRAGRST